MSEETKDVEACANGSQNGSDQQPAPTWLEWGVRTVSFLLVAGLVGFLVTKAVADDQPPTIDLEVVTSDVREDDGRWATPIRAINRGSSGISSLMIEIDTGVPTGSAATRPLEVVIPLLGPGEEKTVTIWLDRDPAREPPRLSARAFQ